MARVVKKAEVRQDELLDVAQGMFLTQGYDNTSVQAIIDAVGIAKGTFYHHYPSKAAVLDALIVRMTAKARTTTSGRTAQMRHAAPRSCAPRVTTSSTSVTVAGSSSGLVTVRLS